jgi:hypothetical protein
MATDKQIEANRANSRRSTGPRTPEGKAASSRNAVRHDLLARAFVLQSECPERFETLVDSFYAEYRPVTATEAALVEAMATARWRLLRLSNLEISAVDHAYADGDSALSIPVRTLLAYRSAADTGRSMELMSRSEARLQIQFNNALDRLRRLRRVAT